MKAAETLTPLPVSAGLGVPNDVENAAETVTPLPVISGPGVENHVENAAATCDFLPDNSGDGVSNDVENAADTIRPVPEFSAGLALNEVRKAAPMATADMDGDYWNAIVNAPSAKPTESFSTTLREVDNGPTARRFPALTSSKTAKWVSVDSPAAVTAAL